MPRSLQSTSVTAPLCWHTYPSSGDDLERDTDLYSHFLSTRTPTPHNLPEIVRSGCASGKESDSPIMVDTPAKTVFRLTTPYASFHTPMWMFSHTFLLFKTHSYSSPSILIPLIHPYSQPDKNNEGFERYYKCY